MLKNIILSLALLSAYLLLLIIFKNLGFHDVMNMMISCVLLGAMMKKLIDGYHYFIISMLFLSGLFFLLKDYLSIPVMLSSMLFGHVVMAFIQSKLKTSTHTQNSAQHLLN